MRIMITYEKKWILNNYKLTEKQHDVTTKKKKKKTMQS